ncbi:MAG TPA: 1,2-phenylacetyl-CoA epoxidase subunit PaaC, partial [Parasegetibacter sp.]
YHLRWSSEWVIRLGDGTEESKSRMEKAIDELWMFTGEMFEAADYEKEMMNSGIGVNPETIRENWEKKVEEVFAEATLTVPPKKAWHQTGGKNGIHTENLGYILAEMQYLQRVYPGAEW